MITYELQWERSVELKFTWYVFSALNTPSSPLFLTRLLHFTRVYFFLNSAIFFIAGEETGMAIIMAHPAALDCNEDFLRPKMTHMKGLKSCIDKYQRQKTPSGVNLK
jgi:hypothetical protein